MNTITSNTLAKHSIFGRELPEAPRSVVTQAIQGLHAKADEYRKLNDCRYRAAELDMAALRLSEHYAISDAGVAQ